MRIRILFLAIFFLLYLGAVYGRDHKLKSEPVWNFYTDSRNWGSDLEPSHTNEEVSKIQVYLIANDLNKAIENTRYLPDAFIIPTNTKLDLLADFPTTQKHLIRQIRKDKMAFKVLLSDVAKFKPENPIKLNPATEVFSVTIAASDKKWSKPILPKHVCMVATDENVGGSEKQRDLYTQHKIQRGIKTCLSQLDEKGAKSVMLPLIGAASGYLKEHSLEEPINRQLMECRLANSIAGISLGIAGYVSEKRSNTNIEEIGIVQWSEDLKKLYFLTDRKSAYSDYADYISKQLLPKTLKGKPQNYREFGDKKSCEKIFGTPEQ